MWGMMARNAIGREDRTYALILGYQAVLSSVNHFCVPKQKDLLQWSILMEKSFIISVQIFVGGGGDFLCFVFNKSRVMV